MLVSFLQFMKQALSSRTYYVLRRIILMLNPLFHSQISTSSTKLLPQTLKICLVDSLFWRKIFVANNSLGIRKKVCIISILMLDVYRHGRLDFPLVNLTFCFWFVVREHILINSLYFYPNFNLYEIVDQNFTNFIIYTFQQANKTPIKW